MQPIIIHLDMNSYFATAEQQQHPEYRGKVLGVCEHLGGIIIAASIEAKRWGIKTGTPVWEARKLYPKIILTKTHPDSYRLYIKRVIRVVSDYTDFVEQYSIDELFADMTKVCNVRVLHPEIFDSNEHQKVKNIRGPEISKPSEVRDSGSRLSPDDIRYCSAGMGYLVDPFEEAVKIAAEIKRRMKKEVGDYLTCSIGIADNKLLAKIASDLKKPDGVVVIRSGEWKVASDKAEHLEFTKEQVYQKLNITDIPGIGHRQEKNLNALGIKTLLDLKNYPKSLLVARFGIMGHHLHQMGRLEGSWKPGVELDSTIKSVGHMYTLPQQYREKIFLVPVLYKLCEMVAKRLRKQGLAGNIIHFHIHPAADLPSRERWTKSATDQPSLGGHFSRSGISGRGKGSSYECYGKSMKLDFYVFDGREIFYQCMGVLEGFKLPADSFKLIGVTVAGLGPYVRQLSLFGHEERTKRLVEALDKINIKYGDFTVCRVPLLGAKQAFQDSVGFGRIKEG